MNFFKSVILILFIWTAISCVNRPEKPEAGEYPGSVYYRNAIINEDKLSAASKRALERNYDQGPEWYIKSEYNPVTNSGHEVIIWHYQVGIAAMLLTEGPERNTIQWAPDGINFEIKSHIKGGPVAAGLVRELDNEKSPVAALKWGLTHAYKSRDWQYIRRFDYFNPFSP